MTQSKIGEINVREDEKLGMLIGMLLTDESISRHGSSWEVEFTNKVRRTSPTFSAIN